ncbi:MAG: porin family protein [Hyphomicrobiales bacterium]|nr:porin family protein [Hyphomicrobiales bacterium]MCP5001709.1 porin family protein [Hyphomicrobiales bacterium]
MAGNQAEGGINTAEEYRVGGSLGYNFSPLLSGEAEISYGDVGIDSIDVGAPFNITSAADGNGSLLTLMGNAIVGKDFGRFRPYVGVGAGAAQVSLDVAFASGVDDRDWTWAAQVFTGVELMLTVRASIGTRYRYQQVGSTSYFDGNTNPVDLDQFGTHSFEAVLKISSGE